LQWNPAGAKPKISAIDENFDRLESMDSGGPSGSVGTFASIGNFASTWYRAPSFLLNNLGQISVDDFRRITFQKTTHLLIGNPSPSIPANPY
jgi:hypothetical protein